MAVSMVDHIFWVSPHNPTESNRHSKSNLPLLPWKDPSTLSLNLLPTTPFKHHQNQQLNQQCCHPLSVAFPALAFSNTLFFASNVALIVAEDEHEDKLIGRFRREVLKAGVLQECRRRRFFECSQDKRKRKSREAARRNRKRRPQQPKAKAETSNKKTQDTNGDDDNWEFFDIDLPYC
ncbi:30S ribosomal protein S21, chloroplastic-like [Salvia splendens]|uniref:30S ribosomal protein S21, chloroplastic-like n=1 Tax=Salvia splendens TaxID=180675 RepID=UPI001C25DF78|nr:30S ribosomal protein S21, chloroplastic-like [Salvia splendens]